MLELILGRECAALGVCCVVNYMFGLCLEPVDSEFDNFLLLRESESERESVRLSVGVFSCFFSN